MKATIKRLTIVSVLMLITGCTPHPGAGIWLSSTTNDAHITKVAVFFEPTVKIYTSDTKDPIMQCGWWALDRSNIEMECIHLPEDDTEPTEKYQLNVIDKNKAELIKQGELVTTLARKTD